MIFNIEEQHRDDLRKQVCWNIHYNYGYDDLNFEICINEEEMGKLNQPERFVPHLIDTLNNMALPKKMQDVKKLLEIIEDSSIMSDATNINKILEVVYDEEHKSMVRQTRP